MTAPFFFGGLMSSLHYICDSDDTDVVYFDMDPTPIPWPVNNRIVSRLQCLRGSSSAGNVRTIDTGAGSGSKTLTITVPHATMSTVTALQTKFDAVAQIKYYDADNDILYTCAWAEGDSFKPDILPGQASEFSLTIRLIIISQV
jgi:hypothetical protein